MEKSLQKVSMIVPVYNGAKTLPRCLDSILGQTYENIEVLLINDGSTDDSEKICREFAEKDSRIHVISKENEGVSATRNRGIEEAAGTYIQFTDCDDYLAKDYIENMVNAMELHGADIVIAGYTRWKEDNGTVKQPETIFYTDKTEFSGQFFHLYNRWFLNTPWNKLFRREKIHCGFPMDMSLGEDLLFNLAYLKECETIQVCSCAGYQYCMEDGNSLGIQFREDKFANSLYLHEQVLAFVRDTLGMTSEEEWKDETFLKEFRFSITNLLKVEDMDEQRKKEWILSWSGEEEVRKSYLRSRVSALPDKLLRWLVLHKKRQWIYPVFRLLVR